MNNLPPGSYLVEVTNPDLFYKPIRVDINSKGKIRARKVNYIQSSAVQQVAYPLKFKPQAPLKYFQIRETWRLTDFLFNPMVLMMVLPLFLIMVLPKMMNDAETQKVRNLSALLDPNHLIAFFSGNAKHANASLRRPGTFRNGYSMVWWTQQTRRTFCQNWKTSEKKAMRLPTLTF